MQFFNNNYSNNPNFNNKSDKIENLRIQMTARHYQISLACLYKDVTRSDIFQFFFLKKNLELCVLLISLLVIYLKKKPEM
jgi:hypothetical protein